MAGVVAATGTDRLRPNAPAIAKASTAAAFLLLYVPLAVLVVYSFLGIGATGSAEGWTLDWYRRVFANELVLDAFRMSLYVGIWSTLASTVLGTMAALAIERTRFPGRK